MKVPVCKNIFAAAGKRAGDDPPLPLKFLSPHGGFCPPLQLKHHTAIRVVYFVRAAPAVFRKVERRIGVTVKRLKIFARVRIDSDAGAGRNLAFRTFHGYSPHLTIKQRPHISLKPFPAWNVAYEHDEFISANAAAYIRRTEHFSDYSCKFPYGMITCGMTKAVVYTFKMVYIYHKQRVKTFFSL